MKKNEKDIQYKIIKSEACGHSIEYRMVKKEIELEKAKIDEGLSAKEKKKARKERSEGFVPHEKEKFHSEGYREYKVPQSQEKLKQKLKSKERPKLPSKEDLEYPMAASEEMEKCIDNPDCDCQEKKKKMKKSSNFYIQKIQELRKATQAQMDYFNQNKSPSLQENSAPKIDTATQGAKLADSMGMPSAQEMAKPLTQDKQPNRLDSKYDPRTNASYSVPDASYSSLNAGKAFSNDKNAYDTKVKSASNNFIGDLASGKNATTQNPTATPSIPMASPTANTPMANPSPNTPGLSPDAAKQAQAAANPAAAPAANPAAAPAANPAAAQKPQSFGEAFNKARNARIAGTGPDTFPWNGKTYHSFQKDDFAQGQGGKYNPAAKAGATAPAAQQAATAPAAQQAATAPTNPTINKPESNIAEKTTTPNVAEQQVVANAAKTPINYNDANDDRAYKEIYLPAEAEGLKAGSYFKTPRNEVPTVERGGESIPDLRSKGEQAVEINSTKPLWPQAKDGQEASLGAKAYAQDIRNREAAKDTARASRVFKEQNAARERLGKDPLTQEQFDEQWGKLPRAEQMRY